MNFQFNIVESPQDFEIARELFKEYADSLGFDLGFQNFEKELQDIHVQYHKPEGGLILVLDGEGKAAGCVGVRRWDDETSELKRMYIRDAYRGKGLGKTLLQNALTISKALAYKKMRLDTLGSMKSAIALYNAAGFYEIEPYNYNPNEDVKYYEIVH